MRPGLSLSFTGRPAQAVGNVNPVISVGLMGSDYPDVRTEALVREGELVAGGEAVMRDRRRPQIVFAAPISGRVTSVTHDAKRRHANVCLIVEPGAIRKPRCFDIPVAPDRGAVRKLLLDAGLWPSLVSRPFGRMPAPDSAPDAIFIAAADTHPLAVDARIVINDARRSFELGRDLIAKLTDGPVFVCAPAGADLAGDGGQICQVEIRGTHPAGLIGAQIGRLFPLRSGRVVWQINYQDVIAIGRLVENATLDATRVVSLAGQGVRNPRLVRIPAGADLDELVAGEIEEGEYRVLSGPPLSGHESRYLARHHWQVTVLPRPRDIARRQWWMVGTVRTRPHPVVPTAAIEQAFGASIHAVPLLRALSVGDAETAERLGCLALLEEDMALATYAAGGVEDFSARLRAVLDMLEEAR